MLLTYSFGRLENTVSRDADGNQVTAVSHEYDGHGRVAKATDARNGGTRYSYNDLDLAGHLLTETYSGGILDGLNMQCAFDDIGNRKSSGGRASAVSTCGADRRNQYTSRTVAGVADIAGIANPTAALTVNGNTANRKGEYFHHALSLPNGSAAHPTVVVTSAYGGGESSTGRVCVAAWGSPA
jgi:hypothetical protein